MEVPVAAPPTPPIPQKAPTLVQRIIKLKDKIVWAWIASYLIGVNILILCFFVPALHPYWLSLGDKTGNLAVILLCVSLIPGIIRRFDLRGPFSQLQLVLMVFRRHLGISMYLLAVAHVLLVKTFPMMSFGLPFALSPFEIAGAIAIMLTTPLFFTSNDFAMTKLGHIWKKIHTAVYAIALLVLLHLILLGGVRPSTILSAVIVFLEGASWASRWYKSKQLRLAIGMLIVLFCSSSAYATYTYQELTKQPTIEFSRESLMIRIPRDANGKALTTIYSADLITSHNTPGDCWSIINGKIYNLTDYVNVHPGGVETIRASCGSDGTDAFATKGGRGRSHSAFASELLAKYLVATVGDALPASVTETIDPAKLPPTPTATPKPIIETTQTLTTDIVSTHRTQSNCWMIINGSVYDVTTYIPYHPGGTMQIVNYCGKEATNAFNTKGSNSSHSANAASILASFRIGALNQKNVTVQVSVPAYTPTPIPAATTLPTPAPQSLTLTTAVIATHNTQGNCWLIINNNVYDVTQYIPYHPGGTMQIVNYCGKESTNAFNTKGSNSSHSANANSILATYKIGAVGSTAVVTPTPKSNPTPTPVPTKLPTPAPTATTQTLTSAVVATHNTQGNCWLIINNNVYDVTQYIPYHPGGTMQIVNYCGKESTNAFNTKGGGGSSHSASANSTLAGYKIGALGSTTTTTPTPVPAGPTPTPQTVSLTSAVVATHNTQGNCWLIINNNVYDVTQYIPYHPGGTKQIVNYCGKEASTAFNTRGGGSSHSTNANNLLAGYKIGTLNGTATITPTPTPNPNATPTPTPRTRNNDDDDD